MGTPTFSGFAKIAVINEVRRFLDDNNRTVRIPSPILEAMYARTKKLESDQEILDQYEWLQSIAEKTHHSVEDLWRIDQSKSTVSIHGPDEDSSLLDTLEYVEYDNTIGAKKHELIQEALKFMPEEEGFPKRMQNILQDRFVNQMGLKEIGDKNRFCKQRAVQMIRKALARLRNTPKAMDLLGQANMLEEDGVE
jgi:DNA-directed RNA polymerase specialized sigma subunit